LLLKARRRSVHHGGDCSQFAKLSEKEKRQRLLEMLRADLGEEVDDICDSEWVMPALDEDGRTTNAGPSFQFDFRSCEVHLSTQL